MGVFFPKTGDWHANKLGSVGKSPHNYYTLLHKWHTQSQTFDSAAISIQVFI